MAGETSIEWTVGPDGKPGASWNPVFGCSIASAGCANCYAMAMAARIERMSGPATPYAGLTKPAGRYQKPVWTGELRLGSPDVLDQPLRWARPRTIFVNSMSDLGHPDMPDAWRDKVFARAAIASWHRYLILTKRPEVFRRYFGDPATIGRIIAIMDTIPPVRHETFPGLPTIPLPNVWLGISTEDQRAFDSRWPELAATPAAIRFASFEPLLGPIDARAALIPAGTHVQGADAMSAETFRAVSAISRAAVRQIGGGPFLDWGIVGGESGAGARPFPMEAGLALVRQFRTTGVPVFMKQLGADPRSGDGAPYPVPDHRKGANMGDWPDELRYREFPAAHGGAHIPV